MEKIKELIFQSNNIGITYHVSPDGDAVGSVLALHKGLKKLGKNSYIISKDKISDNLFFLLNSDKITGEVTETKKDTDLVIVLDCGNFNRISADLHGYKGKIINIDHHISNDYYGDENYVDTKAAATAEVVYELLEVLGVQVDKEIGTCLYTSLVTDTGAFRHSNVTWRTHKIASELKRLDVDNTFIYQSLFDNKSFDKIKLIGRVLTNMELLLDGKVAIFEIRKSLIEDLNMDVVDTSDIISYGLQVKGVEIAILLKEVEGNVKASLRSKNDVDVRAVAEVLGGGGHVKAAGVSISDTNLYDAKAKILEEIEKVL